MPPTSVRVTFGAICAQAQIAPRKKAEGSRKKRERIFMAGRRGVLFRGGLRGLGGEGDEPAGGALVLVEVEIGDALDVGGRDRGGGLVEGFVERPVADGDALVELGS